MSKAKLYWLAGPLLFLLSFTAQSAAQAHVQTSAQNSSLHSRTVGQGVAFSLDPGSARDPMHLLSATFNAAQDLFAGGLARNLSSSGITAYRIGAVLYPDNPHQQPAVRLGPWMSVPEGIAPGARYRLPGQAFSPALMDGRRALVFFVATVKLASGVEWRADIHQITKTYSLSPE